MMFPESKSVDVGTAALGCPVEAKPIVFLSEASD